MANESRTGLIARPPIQTKIYPLLIGMGCFIVLSSLAIGMEPKIANQKGER